MYVPANQPPLSPADIYSGITTPALGGLGRLGRLGAVTNAQIAQFVEANIPGPLPLQAKAQKLVNYMRLHNLTPERVSLATGYPLATVNEVIAAAGPQGGGLGPLLLAIGAFYLLG